ncbi:membrane protein [Paenibacillus sp. 32O-W]|uniref:glycan biosynthesis hexose transferase WsfD n=1 Tax=Paenibacillus sp. 32O-W TaxID=1695218 RepID=UPI000720E2C1|nr:hypothetical protein [Paenibacillus sp. 32O-W]ALS29801.1 membrane protein [Paenibacillus sp. 32O-W]
MRERIRWDIVAVAAGAVILAALLFTKPFIGVADNGDFQRIMVSVGLTYPEHARTYEERFFHYAHSQYSYGEFKAGGYWSSQLIFAMAASLLGRIWNAGAFDIRVLGFLYALTLLAATWIVVRFGAGKSRLAAFLLAAAVLFVFYDIGYVAYFNSFFGEPVSLLFMLMTVGFAFWLTSRQEPSAWLLAAFFASAIMLACSKIQNAPVGVAFALLALRFAALRDDRRWRRRVYTLCAVTVAVSIAMYVAAPKELKHINLYQTVFYGILKDSPDPKRDLRDLGLSEELAVNAGTNYFQTDAPIKQDDPLLEREFYSKLSHKDVAVYYLTHPGRFIDKLEAGAKAGMTIRPYYLGNYEQAEGKPPGALSYAYSAWSEFKARHVPKSLGFLIAFYALYYLILLFLYMQRSDRRYRIGLETLMLIGLVGIFSLCVPLLGDGEADLGKHLFMFNVCFDMMAIAGAVWIVRNVVMLVTSRLGYSARRSTYRF